jgi:glycosyltransferase involved in cell wall biosynthesis
MDEAPVHISDVREAEQARVDFQAAHAAFQAARAATASAEPSSEFAEPVASESVRSQFWLLRKQVRDLARATRRSLRARGSRYRQRRSPLPDAPADPPPQPDAPSAPSPQPGTPRCSVLITVWNNGPVLQRAVDSVYAQSFPDWELVIWDDGTTDPETLTVLDGVSGPRIRKYRGENAGVIAARAAAAEQARGDVLLFLDPDDYLDPTYLEKAVLTLARYPEVGIVSPAVRIHSESHPAKYWYPAHFEERRLAYENSVPISSAMRRSVWEAVGSMPEAMKDGFEDWGFWRAAAEKGFQGWSLQDALLHYTHSETTGRDASARRKRNMLELTLKQLHPYVSHSPGPIDEDIPSLRQELASGVFHLPASEKPSLVVFVPWMLEGGGAETFLLSSLRALQDDFQIVVIATNKVPPKHLNAVNEFLEVTPYVYDLAELVGDAAMADMVESILWRLQTPIILQVGSPWAYANMAAIKRMARHRARVVDVQFNHLGHLPELLSIADDVDHILVAHQRLQALLVDYYELQQPVDVLYIAPPEHELPETARGEPQESVRIGWLGRNSPEKRADLIAPIAAALPDMEFLVAGSALDELPPQPDNVTVVGWVDDALQFLADLDFILNTSDIEGVSVTAMEALRLGVPVITRDVGGMAELVRNGENGVIYDPSHLHALVGQMQDSATRERIRSTAESQRLPDEFHFDTMVETLRVALLGPLLRDEDDRPEAAG